MKEFICSTIFLLFLGCMDDSVDIPSCYVTAYGEVGVLRSDSIEKVGYSSELRYDLGNRIVSRWNYGISYSFRVLSIDSVIYENNRAIEIRKLSPSRELKESYQFQYENNLINAIDYYSIRHRSDLIDTILTKREEIKYDFKKRISTVTVVDTIDYPLYATYDTTKYFYKGANLAEIRQTTHYIDAGNTSDIYQVVKKFSDFDSRRNPMKGIIFPDLRYATYSENNYQRYEEVTYENGRVTSTKSRESNYEYNEQGYPDIGEYKCSL